MADKNQQIAEAVVEHVGGKDNIASALHCMTRLRLVLKDDGLADKEALKDIDGVLTVVEQGGQLQVVIGQNVPKVHAAVTAMGVTSGGSIDEDLDAAPEKFEWTPKNVFDAILGYLSGSMVPMIPVIITAGLFKAISSMIAPGMLGLVAEDSNLITLLDFLYNAGFYFLPIYLGFNAATKLGVTPILGAYMGGILIAPAFVALASEGASFDVFGIPCTPGDYNSTVVPILLSVWVMSYVEKFFKKYVPETLAAIFTPFLTVLVMTPIALCALAPLGSILGGVIGNALYVLGSAGGIISVIGTGLVSALYTPLVTTGMHLTIFMVTLGSFMETGSDKFFLVAATIAMFAAFGSMLGCALRIKEKKEKAKAFSYFVSGVLGGVTEPFIYGLLFRYARLWLTMGAGAFVGAALASILGVSVNVLSTTNLLMLLGFTGSKASNFAMGCACAAVAFVVAAVVTYLFGFTKEDLEAMGK